MLFTHRVDFGVKDPQFNKDIGFYVFQLPFLRFIVDWLFAGLVIVSVRHRGRALPQRRHPLPEPVPAGDAASQGAPLGDSRRHGAREDGAVLPRPLRARLLAPRRRHGASYTDVKAQLPALNLLIFISIVAAGLFIWNIWRRGWVLPIIAVGLWGFVSVVIGTIYPGRGAEVPGGAERVPERAAVHRAQHRVDSRRVRAHVRQGPALRLSAEPRRLGRQSRTRQRSTTRACGTRASSSRRTSRSRSLQTFYKISDVDVDRYTVDDATQQVVLSAREISQGELPSQSWVNQHLVYTHGYGIIASPTNVSAQDGRPRLPPQWDPRAEGRSDRRSRPARLVLRRAPAGYALVDAKQREFDYPRQGGADATTRYKGKDGVKLVNPSAAAAFALRFGDINLLISGQVGGEHEGPVRPRHQGPREEARAVPELRRRSVPGRQRRACDVGARRVHHDESLSVLADDVGTERHRSQHTTSTTSATR